MEKKTETGWKNIFRRINMKKRICLLLAAIMLLSIFAGCGKTTETGSTAATENVEATKPEATEPDLTGDETGKQAPMLQEKVDAGTLPHLADRIPVASDVYVEVDNSPSETPAYGGTMRTNNGGKWYFGPITEEPLFRLLDDGTVAPNVAKGYDVSDDGLVYTIHLREGMKWSDGEPFTAEDCVYYYNYILVTNVDNETGKVTKSATTKYYNWYMTKDPADGLMKPAQVRYVDDTTFTITLYSPKATLLQAICIDNKWMFMPKHWYKDLQAYDETVPHWSGETDLKLVGGEGLTTITEEQALANAKARNSLYTFEDYNMLCKELCYYYWQYAGRPTVRPWVLTSAMTESTLVFERNPYFWKVDAEGRQLPYMDTIEFVTLDDSLKAQEIMAGNIDVAEFGNDEFPLYKASEASGCYSIKRLVGTSWSIMELQPNQTYKDAQYAALFSEIDFRHALSIAIDRDEMNNILYNGMAVPTQTAPPQGNPASIEGETEKWTELDVDGANALLDGIAMISKELNADGYRTFVDGANKGKPIVLQIETDSTDVQAKAVALLGTYFKKIGLQVVEVPNTDNNARNEKLYVGDEVMISLYKTGVFNVMLRPDAVGVNRNNLAWSGKYGLEHQDHWTPEAGSAMEEMVNATKELQAATTIEELQAAAAKVIKNFTDNRWTVGILNDAGTFYAANNRIHNFNDGFMNCDELRFLGYGKPYTWFIQE